MTSCNDFQALFNAYLNNTLSEKQCIQLENHFIDCEMCQQMATDDDTMNILIEQLPRIKMPDDIKQNIFKKINNQEAKRFWDRLSIGSFSGLKLAGAGIAMAMLILVFLRLPEENVKTKPEIKYTQEQLLRAQEQMKWSLVYVNQVMNKTKKQTVEEVLLNQLPSTVRNCVEKTVPFLKGDSQ